MRLLDLEGLRRKGITYSRVQLWRLVKAGKFPKPIRGVGKGNAWVESEVDSYLDRLVAERDAEASHDAAA